MSSGVSSRPSTPTALELSLVDLANHVLTHLREVEDPTLIDQVVEILPHTTLSFYGQAFATAREFHTAHGTYPDAQYLKGCFDGIFTPSQVEAFSDDFVHQFLGRLSQDRFRNEAAWALADNDIPALERLMTSRARPDALAEPVLCCEAPPLPDPAYRQGIYPKHLNLVIGESGISKSSFAVGLGVGCALGREVIPGWVPSKQGKVLYLSGEDDRSVLGCKYAALESVYGLPNGTMEHLERSGSLHTIDAPAALMAYTRDGAAHPTSAGWSLLRRAVRERYAMVIIDPLSHWAGILDENPTGQMGQFAAYLTRLARESGAAVVLVHHASKAGSQGKPDQHSARGSSALAAAARFIVALGPFDATAYRHPDDHTESFVTLYYIKNSYRKRAPRQDFLQGDWGLLTKSNLRDVLLLRLGQEIVQHVRGLEERPTRRELEGMVVAPKFVATTTKSLGGKQHSIKPGDLRDALQRLWDSGRLEIHAKKTGRRGSPRQEVHVVVNEDEEALEDSNAFAEYQVPDSPFDPLDVQDFTGDGHSARN